MVPEFVRLRCFARGSGHWSFVWRLSRTFGKEMLEFSRKTTRDRTCHSSEFGIVGFLSASWRPFSALKFQGFRTFQKCYANAWSKNDFLPSFSRFVASAALIRDYFGTQNGLPDPTLEAYWEGKTRVEFCTISFNVF